MSAVGVTLPSLCIALVDTSFARGFAVLKPNNALRATLNTIIDGVGLASGYPINWNRVRHNNKRRQGRRCQ